MWLLDTNVVSEIRKSRLGRAQRPFQDWIRETRFPRCFVSVITVFELERGVLKIERRDPEVGGRLRESVDGLLSDLGFLSIDIDSAIARRCARLHHPVTLPKNDAWIAATALERNLTLVTRNVADFRGAGVALLNPWDSA